MSRGPGTGKQGVADRSTLDGPAGPLSPALAPTIVPAAAMAPTIAPGLEATVADTYPEPVASRVRAHEATAADDGDARPADLPAFAAAADTDYAVGRELDRGGMGRILAARDRRLRRDVVIKVLSSSAGSSERFEREALITARLQHPSIVRVYDAGRLGDEPFYAMEHVRGQSLDRVLAAAPDARARLALLPHVIAIADAMAYAHSEGVIHRDLKPANVLVGSFGETVVIDWGLAKDVRAPDTEAPALDAPVAARPATPSVAPVAGASDLTVAGAVMGTPAYMPPEQARGEPADERSDVYAIGAILYTLLSGAAPAAGARSLDEVGAGAVTPLRASAPAAPAELVSITEHAMAHDPADRYATAGALAEELRRFAAGQLVATHAYSIGALVRRWLRRHRTAVGVAAAALLALAVLSLLGVRKIVAARDLAEAAEGEAREQAAIARAALLAVEDEHDRFVIDQAQDALAEDPSLALAWLRELKPRGLASDTAHALAAEAAARGVAFELAGPGDDLEHIAPGADPRIVYTGGDDGRLWRWNLAERRGDDLGGHVGPIETMAHAPGAGAWLATGGADRAVRLWDTTTAAARVLSGHADAVRGLAFSPDGAVLASAGTDGALWLWSVAAGTGARALQVPHGLRPVVWSRDGARLWAGAADGHVHVYEVAARRARAWKAHTAEIRWLALSPDGRRLASAAQDGAVRVWDVDSQRGTELGRHDSLVRVVLWHPDSRRVVSAGGDTRVQVLDVGGAPPILLAGNRSGVKNLALSPDGAWVAAAGIDHRVYVWPIGGGPPRELVGHGGSVKAVAFTADGAAVISSGNDDRVRLWPLAPPPPPPRGAGLAAWLAERTNVTVKRDARTPRERAPVFDPQQ